MWREYPITVWYNRFGLCSQFLGAPKTLGMSWAIGMFSVIRNKPPLSSESSYYMDEWDRCVWKHGGTDSSPRTPGSLSVNRTFFPVSPSNSVSGAVIYSSGSQRWWCIFMGFKVSVKLLTLSVCRNMHELHHRLNTLYDPKCLILFSENWNCVCPRIPSSVLWYFKSLLMEGE